MMFAEPSVQVFPDREALSRAAATQVAAAIDAAVAERGRATVVLAGGSTPRRLYLLLADRDDLPWGHLYLFWGDERFVPEDHPASNYRMAREALVQHVPIPADHVFPILTDTATPEAAAGVYESTLRASFGSSEARFDVTLLGLGDDGHTASLFPENTPQEALSDEASRRWVEAVVAPPRYEVRSRISLTLPALNASRQVFFLVSGQDKRDALHAVLHDPHTTLPAAFVRAQERLAWLVDEAALGRKAGL